MSPRVTAPRSCRPSGNRLGGSAARAEAQAAETEGSTSVDVPVVRVRRGARHVEHLLVDNGRLGALNFLDGVDDRLLQGLALRGLRARDGSPPAARARRSSGDPR